MAGLEVFATLEPSAGVHVTDDALHSRHAHVITGHQIGFTAVTGKPVKKKIYWFTVKNSLEYWYTVK